MEEMQAHKNNLTLPNPPPKPAMERNLKASRAHSTRRYKVPHEPQDPNHQHHRVDQIYSPNHDGSTKTLELSQIGKGQ